MLECEAEHGHSPYIPSGLLAATPTLVNQCISSFIFRLVLTLGNVTSPLIGWWNISSIALLEESANGSLPCNCYWTQPMSAYTRMAWVGFVNGGKRTQIRSVILSAYRTVTSENITELHSKGYFQNKALNVIFWDWRKH